MTEIFLPMNIVKRNKAILALIAANIIWGASAPIFKWSLENIDPFLFAFLRFFISALIILPFAGNKLKIHTSDFVKVLIASFAGISLSIMLFFWGLQLTSSINAPIIGATGPIFILLFSLLFLHEKSPYKIIIGTGISLFGVLYIVVQPVFSTASNHILGNLFLLLATLCSVLYIILIKQLIQRYSFTVLSFWTFLLGSLALMPFALYSTYSIGFLTHVSFQGLFGLGYSILFSSVIAYSLFSYGIKNLEINESEIFTYIGPLANIAVAIPLLGERLSLSYFIGAFFIFLGIYLVEVRTKFHPVHKMKYQ